MDALQRKDPQIVRAVLSKISLLERDPYAGRPLVGDLIGWRKLVVGNRQWRIVWRVVTEADGTTVVEVSEIWAVGAREDAAVYAEVRRRIDRLPESPVARGLTELLARFGDSSPDATEEAPSAPEPVPDWLTERLITKAGLPPADVGAMTLDEAIAAWETWMSRPQR